MEHQSASVWSVCTVTVPVRYRTHFAAVAVALPLYRTLPARHFIHVSVPLLSRWYSVCWCECTNCNFTLNVSDTQRARRSQRATRLPGGVQQARAHAFASNAYERLREVWIEQVGAGCVQLWHTSTSAEPVCALQPRRELDHVLQRGGFQWPVEQLRKL